MERLRKLYITLHFTEVITQVHSYTKFLKDIICKRRIEEHGMVLLNEECSAVIQNNYSPKLKDLGFFAIPIHIGKLQVEKTLCDLGASLSLMSYSMCEKLGMVNLKPTSISLKLVDKSARIPEGVLEDVQIRLENFVFLLVF